MKKRRGFAFIVIGILLLILGAYILTFDLLVGMLAVGVGLLIFIKGYRLTKGVQPKDLRRYEEREKEDSEKLKEKKQERIRKRNSNSTQNHDN